MTLSPALKLLSGSLAVLAAPGVASAQQILVWATGNAGGSTAGVATWIEDSGQFESVTSSDALSLVLADLDDYDAVLFFTNGDGDPVGNGNALADYLDGGGALVVMTFAWAGQGNNTVGGRFTSEGYSPFTNQGTSLYANADLDTTDATALWTGVDAITAQYRDDVALAANATLRGSWSDGRPLAARLGRCLGLDYFPDDSYGAISGDYRALVINALADVLGGGCVGGAPNGILEGNEACDDGDWEDFDACTSDCRSAVCGDAHVRAGVEDCDDGNQLDTDACTSDCLDATCGDGFVWDGVEDCDDGDLDSTDACTSRCEIAVCGDGFVRAGVEDCDDGDLDDGDACTTDCEIAACGDGFVRVGVEECDDGDLDDGDACTTDCEDARCGDGFVRAGVEDCDDGDEDDGDACTTDCEDARCGDGVVYDGVEDCDDGNARDGDGCSSDCVAEEGPDGDADADVDADADSDTDSDADADTDADADADTDVDVDVDADADADGDGDGDGDTDADDDDDGGRGGRNRVGCMCRTAPGSADAAISLAPIVLVVLLRRRGPHRVLGIERRRRARSRWQ